MSNPKDICTDVTVRLVAKVYAQALYDVAEKAGELDLVIEELDSLLDDVYESEPHLEVLLSGAATGREFRRGLIQKVFQPRSSKTFANFLQVLNDHDRLELARPVRQAMRDIFNARHRRVRVFVTSVTALGEAQTAVITDAIARRFELEPIVESIIDPSILGGLKIRVGTLQLDASVRTRIDNLRQQLLTRSGHEIQTRRDHYSTD